MVLKSYSFGQGTTIFLQILKPKIFQDAMLWKVRCFDIYVIDC